MKVVLKQDIKGSGKKDEVVEVSDGYARNYLFPRKLAVPASSTALNDVKNKEQAKHHHEEEILNAAKQQGVALKDKTITVAVKTSPNGKIYGTVTAKDVSDAIKAQTSQEVDKRKITVADIKNLGEYTATIKLHSAVTTQVKLLVTAAQ